MRDDTALAAGEDLDREPDGIPHGVMAAIVLATLVVAAILLLLLSGHVPRHGGAILAVLVAIPVLFAVIFVAARRWRSTHNAHPAR